MTAGMVPAGAAAQDHAPLLDTSAVQAVLHPDEIVFAFSLSEPNSFRWVIAREYFVFDRIAGRKTIEAQAVRLHQAPRSSEALLVASRQLGALLFENISTADDRPLIVVPDGVLRDVPFELLEFQGRRISERHEVSYAPSLHELVQMRREGKPRDTVPLALALGLSLVALLVVAAHLRKHAQNR